MRAFPKLIAAGALACSLLVSGTAPVLSSDHQDTVYLNGRPGADITDVFLFPAADPKKVVLAMDVHPLIPTGESGDVAFDPGVLYQFHIANDPMRSESHLIQFKASGEGADQTIGVYMASPGMAPGTTATLGRKIGTATLNQRAMLPGRVQVFAGAREEPFSFDLSQFLKIDPDRDVKKQPVPPPPSASCFRTPGKDFFTGFNVLSLVVEVPRNMFADAKGQLGVVHVWATTSIERGGRWTQIERLGRPAIKEAFESFKQHQLTNAVTPYGGDTVLRHAVYTYMVTPKPSGAGRSVAIATAVTKTLIPDQLTANLAADGPARYLAVETNGKSGLPVGILRAVPDNGIEGIKKALPDPARQFGGRDLYSPVMDLSLGAIYGSIVPKIGLAPDDHRETPCLTSDHSGPAKRHITKTFPYLGNPS
jgi:hypothetical protein